MFAAVAPLPVTTSTTEIPEAAFSTPMMQQYLKLKQEYADCLLFFRLGDFYELFLADAKIGAQILGITLTSRSRGQDGRIPMAGVPYHAAETYIARLLAAGYKVAICEQMTEATGRGLVDRQIVRVLTPGTVTSEQLLTSHQPNYVLALWPTDHASTGVAVADISTGEVRCGTVTEDDQTAALERLLAQFQPAEIIVPTTSPENWLDQLNRQAPVSASLWPQWPVAINAAKKALKQHLGTPPVKLSQSALEPAHWALAGLLSYLGYTQKQTLLHLSQPLPLWNHHIMQLDQAAITNLELFQTLRQQQTTGSLFEVINLTVTASGARCLHAWLRQPSTDLKVLTERHDQVERWLKHSSARQVLRQTLSGSSDLERLVSRLSLGTGTARDLRAIGDTIGLFKTLVTELTAEPAIAPSMRRWQPELTILLPLAEKITDLIVPEPPVVVKPGSLIQPGKAAALDVLRQVVTQHRQHLATLEATERQHTGISSLKVRYNQVFGFYIEVSKANLSLVPESFQRLQTLVNAERFTTPQLKHHEQIILQTEAELHAAETALYQQLVAEVIAQAAALQKLAQAIAETDTLATLAEVASRYNYCRPEMVADRVLALTKARHPVLERLPHIATFVPNDLQFGPDTQTIMLITGPNMAGKSVLMRQVALIVLLAHIGSFVPAQAATIGITDRIFVRSGAGDMITAGLSTFMVEMVETAAVLRTATKRSLIIMDEIGRGTSTFDGISIAWAVAEYLLADQLRGTQVLFATHYHELQALAETHPGRVANYHLAVTQHHDQLVFLYQLQDGGSAHSHGLAVAKLAGLPPAALSRARELLTQLEQRTQQSVVTDTTAATPAPAPLETALRELAIDQLTPLEALNWLADQQRQLRPPTTA